MSTTSFQDKPAAAVVVVVVEPVGIVGNSERRGELSTSPQANLVIRVIVLVAAYAGEI